MKYGNLTVVAIRSILKNRMRSLLTMLGIVIGVGSVITMISLGEGAQHSVESKIASLGTNLLIVIPGTFRGAGVSHGAGSLETLTMKDVDAIRTKAENVQYVSPVINSRNQVIAGRNNWYTTVTGVDPEYLIIRDWKMASGSFITTQDVKSRKKVAVLGATVAENLFPDQDPLGERIRIRNVPFTVIGVMQDKGQNAMGHDADDVIFAPSATVMYRLSDGQSVQSIMVSASTTELMDQAQSEIQSILRTRHRLALDADDDFTIRSQTEINETASEVTKTFTIFLAAIASVSLLVGGIGIMNIMLVSVTERTREIGIRLAVGARGADVLVQFLIESVVLCLLGGFIGILTGLGSGYVLSKFINMTIRLNPSIMIFSFLFSGAVGVFFGFYPARKAARMDPIEALRYE